MAKKNNRRGSKNPWIAAILNLLWAGLGYIYLGKRKNFGYILFVAGLLALVDVAMNLGTYAQGNYSNLITPLVVASAVLMELAFAYDAFKLAQGKE